MRNSYIKARQPALFHHHQSSRSSIVTTVITTTTTTTTTKMAQPVMWQGYIRDPGDPSSAENWQAWMRAYFAWVVPNWDPARFVQIQEYCLEYACQAALEGSSKHPTEAFFSALTDRLTWEKCHSTLLRVTPAPEWPWGNYVPRDDPDVVGKSPTYQRWLDNRATGSKMSNADMGNGPARGEASSAPNEGGPSSSQASSFERDADQLCIELFNAWIEA